MCYFLHTPIFILLFMYSIGFVSGLYGTLYTILLLVVAYLSFISLTNSL